MTVFYNFSNFSTAQIIHVDGVILTYFAVFTYKVSLASTDVVRGLQRICTPPVVLATYRITWS